MYDGKRIFCLISGVGKMGQSHEKKKKMKLDCYLILYIKTNSNGIKT